MTRLRKGPGTAELEREYLYSDPPITLTDLADKHGLARSNVADKARIGKWYERREEFRRQLSEKAREILLDEFVEYEVANRKKLLDVAAKYFDKYVTALDSGEVKVNTRDMILVASMWRTLVGDLASKPADDPKLVGGGEFEGSAADAQAVIAQVKALMAGGEPK